MDAREDWDPKDWLATAHGVWEAARKHSRVALHRDAEQSYFYRPGEVIIATRYERELFSDLREVGARRASSRRRTGSKEKLEEALGMRIWELEERNDTPGYVEYLRTKLPTDEVGPVVGTNNVLGGMQAMRFGPGGRPRPTTGGRGADAGAGGAAGGRGVRVAILDTGFVKSSTAHPLLDHDYEDDGGDEDMFFDEETGEISSVFAGHGTFIAGIIRQQALDTVLDPEVTLDQVGLADDFEVAGDLLELGDDCDIVNLSLAGYSQSDRPPPALAAALSKFGARERQPIVVCAAGNDGNRRPMWPAAFGTMDDYAPFVVGVAAVDRERQPAEFTNRGPWVGACTFGVSEVSTYLTGTLLTDDGPLSFDGTAAWSGTSFAAPRIAGIVAREMTNGNGGRTARQALEAVLGGATDVIADCGRFVE